MGRPKEVSDEQIVATARRCFLSRGASISAAEIARELGVSHTTLFNRFGSKEALMLAALGPPTSNISWVSALEAGPDARPLRDQLVAHARLMLVFYQQLHEGIAVLQAAGIDPASAHAKGAGQSPPEQAYAALVAWITRAQTQKRLARCEPDALAAALLAALQGWAVSARVCGRSTCATEADRFVERYIDLLWSGVGVEHIEPAVPSSSRTKDRRSR